MKHSSYIRPLIAGLTLAIASGVTFAQNKGPGAGDGQQGQMQRSGECDHAGKGHGGKGHDGKGHGGKGDRQARQGMKMQLPADVLASLKLTDAQKAQYEQAQTATAAMRQSMKQGMKEGRGQGREQMMGQNFDPKAMFERQNARFAQMQAARETIQKQWLGFWDGLNEQQKTVIQDHFKSRMQRG